ncbi:MAG TPA: hypothetical protein VGS22_05405 [Thermoanaerobaculia bacterium]|jgi:hypothetical protein|nr:hypothetical protein [Thermoanaerobaculia bacterium]
MAIPVSCGRLRFEEGRCFLEHRSTSNHVMRTPLIHLLEGNLGTSEEAALFLRDLGLGEGDQVFVDGFLVGDQPDLTFAVARATQAPSHRGILIYSGQRSLLQKTVGTRLLRRFGSPVSATQMLQSCGKQGGLPIEVFGAETLSSNGIASIEIDHVVGCHGGGGGGVP